MQLAFLVNKVEIPRIFKKIISLYFSLTTVASE